jgi:hypothetical protein
MTYQTDSCGKVHAAWGTSLISDRFPSWIAALVIALGVMTGLFFSPPHLQAQVGTGDVLGTVTDSTGAVLPDAKVTIKNQGTAAVRSATTNAKGEFTFSSLPNGTYTLTVEMTGFKIYVASGLPLSTGDRARYDAKLETGAVTETVEVTGTAAEMQTDSSEVSSTVEEKAVADLPLNGRSLEAAIQVQPGIQYAQNGNSQNDRRPSFDIAAANGGKNNEMVDGFDNNERADGLDGIRPSVDSVQEVKVDTSSYSAEYGRASGAVVNIITKAGTNDFHGSLYEFLRNDIFDAQSYSFGNTIPKAKLRQNYYGGSLGGPVWLPKLYNGKNKTFFFVDYEKYSRIAGIASTPLSIPTLHEEQEMVTGGDLDLCDVAQTPNGRFVNGNFQGLQGLSATQCNVSAANIDPIMKNYFLMFPKPNYGSIGNATLNYVSNPPEVQNLYNLDVRIDQHIGNNDVLFGRYEADPTTTTEPEEFPQITKATIDAGIYSQAATPFIGIYPGGNGTGFTGPAFTKTYGLQLDEVHIFNQNLLMELKAAYTRINIQSLPWNYNTGAAVKAGWDKTLDTEKVLPSVGGPFSAWTALLGTSNALPIFDVNNNFQYAWSMTYTHGTNDFKFGVGLIQRQINYLNDAIAGGFFLQAGSDNTSSPLGSPSPSSMAGGGGPLPFSDDRENLLSGNPFLELRSDSGYGGYRTWEPSVYALDNWRVNPKLTLNLGVRYDIYTPFTEAHNKYSNFMQSCLNASDTTPLADGSSCWVDGSKDAKIGIKTDYTNVQPRIGAAYSLDSKTVIRGAIGLAYFTPDVGVINIGSGAPASILQNINPQQAFNIGSDVFPYGAPGPSYCYANPATPPAPQTNLQGCIDRGPAQPVLLTSTSEAGFAINPLVTAVSSKPTNFKSQYTEMANFAVQRQFGANTVTVAYVGSFMRRGLRADNADVPAVPGAAYAADPAHWAPDRNGVLQPVPVNPVYGYTVNGPPGTAPTLVGDLPYVNTIAYLHNGAYSNYNALQLIYDRHFAQGLSLGGNYTWGKSLANNWGDNIPTEPAYLEYGGRPSQRAAVHASYELPFGKRLTGVGSVLIKGWKLNGVAFWQTGDSFSVTSGSKLDISGVNTDRPDQIANTKLSHPTTSMWFNTQAFADQTLGTYGSEHVNQIVGPSQRDIDFSINKDFPIFEHLKGEFRAESFNLTNTPNFADPNGTMGASTYGVISTTQGNPRQLQFAIKLLF